MALYGQSMMATMVNRLIEFLLNCTKKKSNQPGSVPFNFHLFHFHGLVHLRHLPFTFFKICNNFISENILLINICLKWYYNKKKISLFL